jgi:hypothetical protein
MRANSSKAREKVDSEGTCRASFQPQPPALRDVQPASGTGLAQTFTFRATSVNGYQYLTQLHAILDITPAAFARCWIYYNRLQNYRHGAARFAVERDVASKPDICRK